MGAGISAQAIDVAVHTCSTHIAFREQGLQQELQSVSAPWQEQAELPSQKFSHRAPRAPTPGFSFHLREVRSINWRAVQLADARVFYLFFRFSLTRKVCCPVRAARCVCQSTTAQIL